MSLRERLVVVWRVTEHCNLGCQFCAYDRALTRERRSANPEDVLAFGRTLSAYRKKTGGDVFVSWLGGEPLSWAPLVALEAELHGTLGLTLGVTTNGTTIASTHVRGRLLVHYAEITISVDGLGGVHDRLRGWPGGFQHLRRFTTALAVEKQRRGAGPLLRANIVLMRDNVNELAELCFELARWGIEEVTLNQLGGADRPEFYPDHRLLPSDVERLTRMLPEVRPALGAAGLRLRGSEAYFARLAATAGDRRVPIDDCAPGQRFLFVSEAGLASPCSFSSAEYGIPVRELATPEALASLPLRFAEARKRRRLPACGDCHSTQVFGKFSGPS